MLSHRMIPFGTHQVRAEAQRMQPRVQRLEAVGQDRVAGNRIDAVVDRAIDAIVARQVVAGVRLLHLPLQRAEFGEIGVGHA